MTATIDTTPELAPVSDAKALREAFSCFPSGVVAVCCLWGGEGDSTTLIGMAASSFTTVSLDPPLVSVCVQNTSTTWPQIRTAPAIGGQRLRRRPDRCVQAARRAVGTPVRRHHAAEHRRRGRSSSRTLPLTSPAPSTTRSRPAITPSYCSRSRPSVPIPASNHWCSTRAPSVLSSPQGPPERHVIRRSA